MTSIARMRTVVIDCPDPAVPAELHRLLVGGEVTSVADDRVVLEPEPGRRLAFRRCCPPDDEVSLAFVDDTTEGEA